MAENEPGQSSSDPQTGAETDLDALPSDAGAVPEGGDYRLTARALEAETWADSWVAGFFLRYRIPAIAGAVLTLIWFGISYSVVSDQIGWGNVLHLLPHEIGGMAAGIVTPVALLWMVVAFFERGRSLRRETAALRYEISRLAYPSETASVRVREISDSLRRQARDLPIVNLSYSLRSARKFLCQRGVQGPRHAITGA